MTGFTDSLGSSSAYRSHWQSAGYSVVFAPQSGIVIRCSRCIADIVDPGSGLTSRPQVGPPWTGVSQTPSGISVPSLPEPPDCLFPFWNKQRRAFTSEVEERPSQVKESDAYFAFAQGNRKGLSCSTRNYADTEMTGISMCVQKTRETSKKAVRTTRTSLKVVCLRVTLAKDETGLNHDQNRLHSSCDISIPRVDPLRYRVVLPTTLRVVLSIGSATNTAYALAKRRQKD